MTEEEEIQILKNQRDAAILNLELNRMRGRCCAYAHILINIEYHKMECELKILELEREYKEAIKDLKND